MDQKQDILLISRIKKGDETAFKELFNIYFKYLLVTVSNITGDRHLARDLAQEVFFNHLEKKGND